MGSQPTRRALLKTSACIVAAALPGTSPGAVPPSQTTLEPQQTPLEQLIPPASRVQDNAIDEAYWGRVAAQYKTAPEFVNLENGFYGIMARPVLANYRNNVEYLNEYSSYYLRQHHARELDAARRQIATAAGVRFDEIAITRGATEALQNLIVNYRGFKPGDTVVYADLDYDSAQSTLDYLKERRGIEVAKIVIPEPATHDSVIDAYARAFEQHPKTRLVLLTHINNKTGLVMPVQEITRLAKQKNIDVLLDAAHSWGHVDFKVPELGVDFGAFNLHKWIGAPLGVGFLYIRRGRLKDVAPHLSADAADEADIRTRVHTGTTATANVMTISAALEFHQRIGTPNKEARLRYLRNYWVSRVRGFNGVQILTPDDSRLYAGITSFRLAGKTSKADNVEVARRLREDFQIFTVARGGVEAGDVVRVTPSYFTTPANLDRLVAALKTITQS